MSLSMAFALLLGPAFRAALLGIVVWALLRLTRVRDAQAEIMIWTAVLIASALMPLLSQGLPGGLAVPLPSLAVPTGAASGTALVSDVQQAGSAGVSLPLLLWTIYGIGAAIGVARLATGLVLTLRLYRAATPVTALWAAGVRASADVSSPITFGTSILLPSDCCDWPEAKLLAVLAHERSHVRRGDFFIQLFAGLHRALFWFSPFAWWLQQRLCALAEIASDEAAIRVLNDRASYAEILIDVSRSAHHVPALVAMAKGPTIFWRVDHILRDMPVRDLSATARGLAVTAILPAACLLAAAHAAVGPSTAQLHTLIARAVGEPAAVQVAARASHPVAATRHRHIKVKKAAAAEPKYNPRALLEDNDAVVVRALVPVVAKGSKKKPGDPAIILNTSGVTGD